MEASGTAITPTDIEKLKNSTNHDWIKDRVVAEKYLILNVIAAGGMGIVLKARHLQLNAEVAVKFSFDSKDSNAAQRFLNEAQVLTKLRHPGVAQVLDAGTEAGALYLVMELIDGESLLSVVKDSYKLTGSGPDLEELFPWLLGIADALDYCHGQGVVHRDLKPANVILRSSDGQPVLVDFGLAMWEDQSDPEKNKLTQTGEIMGTPHYMAPEQVENHSDFGDIGPASDVWALGAILFYCLSGETPYPAGPAIQFYSHIMMKDPRPLKEVNEEVSLEINEFCSDCLTRESEQRPSMSECREFFDTYFQASEPNNSSRLLIASIFLACVLPLALVAIYLNQAPAPLEKPFPEFKASAIQTRESTSTLSGKVYENIVSVEINGIDCPINEHGEFSKEFPLKEGRNLFKAVVKNREGRELSREIEVNCDRTNPVISIEPGPREGLIILEAGGDLKGRITETGPVKFFLNDQELDLNKSKKFQWSWPGSDKIKFIDLRAEDATGNSASLGFTVMTRAFFNSFNEQFKKASGFAKSRNVNDKEKALVQIRELIDLCPRSALLPKVYRLQHQIYDSMKNKEEALESLNKGLRLCKFYFQESDDSAGVYSELHSLRGSCRLWKFRQYKSALEDYNQGLKLDPRKTGNNPNRAHCHRRLGNPKEAMKILNASIENDQNAWSAYIYRAEMHKEQKRYKASLRDYESAIKLKKSDPHGHYQKNAAELKEKIAKGEGLD